MTVSVKRVLDKLSSNEIFENKLYFVGGTALSYYLNHRISEDIDIVSPASLPYKKIIPSIASLGAKKLDDEDTTALRIAGLFPEEYIIKFVFDNVKLEFFYANRTIQKEILADAKFNSYDNKKLKILDLKSISKLKIVALIMRNKSRDLFDFGAIMENNILSQDEIINLFYKVNKNIKSIDDIVYFINSKKESKDDELVYLDEANRINLTFDEVKEVVINRLIKV